MESGKGSQLLYVTLALLAVVGGAAYVERNVLLGSMPSIREIRKLDELVVGSGVPPPLPQTRELSPPPLPPPSFTQAKEGKLSLVPAPPSLTVDLESVNLQPPRQIALAAAVAAAAIPPDDEAAVVDEVANLQAKVTAKTAVVRAMKFERHMIMETDLDALAATHELQEMCKKLVPLKYGPEPYVLEMRLAFPASFPDLEEKGASGVVQVEMAPLELMPYSVLTFLDMVVHEWKGGAFHRNAGHVKQVSVKGQQHFGFPLAFQEYSPSYPHTKYSLGFAGRPSSSAFYVSTVDNSQNHGPGSQGSKTEADACFAKLVGAASKSGPSVDAIRRLDKQPGAQGGNGFVSPASNHVVIESFKLLRT